MKWTIIFGIFWFFLATVAAAVANETPSALTCNVTVQPDWSYLYQLSHAPNLSKKTWCQTEWEHQNRTVIVHTQIGQDPVFDANLVLNLTHWSVTLRHCYDFLRHRQDCGTWEEAVCSGECCTKLRNEPD
ncbi:hypothetical protein EPR50_G00103380 [Perca flavescens]|uniref:Uncharacterized protein n=1 Tax=Perca flavescens TaxID=8167 RepID=A0A484D147_PERFV|nr:hypothetical protein EPR50_G00103380 [Perca flavescens]